MDIPIKHTVDIIKLIAKKKEKKRKKRRKEKKRERKKGKERGRREGQKGGRREKGKRKERNRNIHFSRQLFLYVFFILISYYAVVRDKNLILLYLLSTHKWLKSVLAL